MVLPISQPSRIPCSAARNAENPTISDVESQRVNLVAITREARTIFIACRSFRLENFRNTVHALSLVALSGSFLAHSWTPVANTTEQFRSIDASDCSTTIQR